MQVTYAYFQKILSKDPSQGPKFEIKFLKQQMIYKNFIFDLNEVFGIDSNPYTNSDTQ